MLYQDSFLDGYRILRFIGRGGFGEVWLCRSETMGDFRALKFISTTNPDLLDKEYQALAQYRKAAALLRSPHLMPIEHVNRNESGLYYLMPLADGVLDSSPLDESWTPLSLALIIQARSVESTWFTSEEICTFIVPILQALQTLSEAGLVHRDIKPENILFFDGQPCLADISLLGEDSTLITRRGTPGYATPSWYVGGHPDMYGIAATLYTLLTGNMPDCMGRSAFNWPPQGEKSLTEADRTEWKRLHHIIRRACHEKPSERFLDFQGFIDAIREKEKPVKAKKIGVITAMAGCSALVTALAISFWPTAKQSPTRAPSDKSIDGTSPQGSYAEFEKAVGISTGDSESFKKSALDKQVKGDLKGALEDMNKAMELNHLNSSLYLLRARIKDSLGDWEGAEYDYMTNLSPESQPEFVEFSLRQAKAMIVKEDWQKAYTSLDHALLYGSKTFEIYKSLGFVWSKMKGSDDAISSFTKALKLNPDDAETYAWRGLQNTQYIPTYKKWNDGIKDLLKACELAPRNDDFTKHLFDAYLKAAVFHSARSEYEEANAFFKSALDIYPSDIELLKEIEKSKRQQN